MEASREQQVHRDESRCPFCHDPITGAKPIVACAACGARQHEACHDEHGACSSCGAAEVLVQQAPSAARARREQPLRGSTITVEADEDNGTVTYHWPRFRNRPAALALIVFLTATVLLSPIALLIFIDWWRKEPLRVVLEPKRLRLICAPSGHLGRQEHLVSRRDIGNVLLDRSMSYTRLTIDIGVERVVIASVSTLTEPELEWLHQAILAWKAEG